MNKVNSEVQLRYRHYMERMASGSSSLAHTASSSKYPAEKTKPMKWFSDGVRVKDMYRMLHNDSVKEPNPLKRAPLGSMFD